MNHIVMQAILGRDMKRCLYCNQAHETICPQIKAIEWDSDGGVRRVELLTPTDHPVTVSANEIKFFEGR